MRALQEGDVPTIADCLRAGIAPARVGARVTDTVISVASIAGSATVDVHDVAALEGWRARSVARAMNTYMVALLVAGCDTGPAAVVAVPDAPAVIAGTDARAAFAVTGMYPSGPFHVEDRITILGSGFGDPPDVEVFVLEETLLPLPGSDDHTLVVELPIMMAGTYHVAVRKNPQGLILYGPDIVIENIKPTVVAGDLFVALTSVAGSHLGFTVWAETNLDETYVTACTADDAAIATTPAEVVLSAWTTAEATTASFAADLPPGAGRLQCTVTSTRFASFYGTTGAIVAPVAHTIPLLMDVAAHAVASSHEAVVVEPGAHAKLNFEMIVRRPGSYTIAVDVGAGWSASTETPLNISAIGPGILLPVQVSATAGAAPTDLVLTVHSASEASESGEYRMHLATSY
jgi:hypothetical protein